MPSLPELTDLLIDVHSELAEWLGSDVPPKVFDRFAAALDDRFTAVTLTGEVVDRETLLQGVWSARNSQPGLEILISNVELLAHSPTLIALRCTAENHCAGTSTRRLVTALLTTDGRTHLLRSLHETAVPAER